MLSALQIKNVTFAKSINGFKREEVEVFLDKVESDYSQFERLLKEQQAKIEELEEQIRNFKNSQDSIQTVLLNAQKLADSIINEAKVKSEEIVLKAEQNINTITEQEKELANAFEIKANERKQALQIELDAMIEKANVKSKSIMAAADDAVKRQQILFDKLKLEISTFKSSINAKYKEHLTLLKDIPDTVEMSPEKVAEIISARIDKLPNIDTFLPGNTMNNTVEETLIEDDYQSGFSVDDI